MEENKEKVETKEESVKEAEVVTNNETVQEKKVNSYALASFICSLVGLLVCGLPLGIAAVITGGYALNSYKEEKENGKWMAVTGLALGIIDIVCVIIYLSTRFFYFRKNSQKIHNFFSKRYWQVLKMVIIYIELAIEQKEC